jgi:superfamily II DNA or RNA helicase
MSTYLGPKGYTIFKECLDLKELRVIRDELNVKPYIPKAPVQPPAYPVFVESSNKIYLPRYYGLKHYGAAEENRLPLGQDIQLNFAGDLRDYQHHIVAVYLKAALEGEGGGLLEIPCGRGKTVIALKIIADLKKKTLVIVHKGFLLNQWIERIEQFLPGAKVGRIQGPHIDIEGKDIVIGMLQSLSMKDYPAELFHSFGLTIVDECHHISSEVFCRSLQKIITRYTLGLSATMQRKDGLTKVFKMFLGDIVYSEERETTDQVLVKGIHYISTNAEFNEMCYDYRGNPAYSTLISKLCAFSDRSEFILKVLETELHIAPAAQASAAQAPKQIMILAHNKNLLTYLHDAIKHRGWATVGYYVGGMKEADLKKSETCQVIIATYAMASEALDIKTLTTLFLATPKTDIIQAVGRILRVKHEQPLVVDFIDTHDVFQSQWQKRKKYYASNNYTIIQTKSPLYLASVAANASASVAGPAANASASVAGPAGPAPNIWTHTPNKVSKKNSCKGPPHHPGQSLQDKHVAATALLINTIVTDGIDEEDDMNEEYMDDKEDKPFKRGRCLIAGTLL